MTNTIVKDETNSAGNVNVALVITIDPIDEMIDPEDEKNGLIGKQKQKTYCSKNFLKIFSLMENRGRGRPDYREYRRYSPDRGPPVKRMRQEWGDDGRPLRYGGKFRLGN